LEQGSLTAANVAMFPAIFTPIYKRGRDDRGPIPFILFGSDTPKLASAWLEWSLLAGDFP
jgi:hypothetical protein